MVKKFTNIIDQLIQEINERNLWKETRTFKRNEFIKMADSVDNNIYFIQKGCLRVYTVSEEEHTIRFGYKDNIITSLDSFLSGKPSPMYIQAIKETEVQILTKSNFDLYINESLDGLQLWNTILSAAIIDMLEREQDLLIANPSERYARVLARSPQLFQEVPHKYIASYLKMTPETFSRIKKHG